MGSVFLAKDAATQGEAQQSQKKSLIQVHVLPPSTAAPGILEEK